MTTVLDRVHALAPSITARAATIEQARRLPHDVLGDLEDAGCFRVALPESHGGLGADLPTALSVFETLARADASTGWTVMIGALGWCDLAALPRASFDALFAGRSGAIVAGAFAPSGTAEPKDGGYVVTGRWAFASGCEHADWFFGNCVESVVDGRPNLRMAVLAPDEVGIEDTWDVSGLRGTGSHHFHAHEVLVPADRTLVPLHDPPNVDSPIARVPTPSLFALGIAAVALGTARGALDDVLDLASGKVPLLADRPLAQQPSFQHDVAEHDTTLRAAGALLADTASVAWDIAQRGDEPTWTERARVRAAAVWVTARAAEAVSAAYRAGGGTALYSASPLQRRLRDVNAITQHFLVREDTLTTAGAVYAGQDVAVPVF